MVGKTPDDSVCKDGEQKLSGTADRAGGRRAKCFVLLKFRQESKNLDGLAFPLTRSHELSRYGQARAFARQRFAAHLSACNFDHWLRTFTKAGKYEIYVGGKEAFAVKNPRAKPKNSHDGNRLHCRVSVPQAIKA